MTGPRAFLARLHRNREAAPIPDLHPQLNNEMHLQQFASVEEESFFSIIDNPFETFDQIFSGHSAAPNDDPLMRFDRVELEALVSVQMEISRYDHVGSLPYESPHPSYSRRHPSCSRKRVDLLPSIAAESDTTRYGRTRRWPNLLLQ